MRFKFIGDYTNGRNTITMHGVTFEGDTPVNVDDALVDKFKAHREFKAVTGRAAKEADDGDCS